MRIGIEITPLSGTRTGVGHFLACLLGHMLRQRDEDEFLGLVTGLHALPPAEFPDLAVLSRLPIPTRLLYACWDRFRRPAVDRLLGGVDLYHATNYFLPPVARAQRVLTVYDLAFLRRPDLCSPAIVGPFARAVPRSVREADHIFTCSESTKRDLIELLAVPAHNISVVYGAVDAHITPMDRDLALERVRTHHGIHEPFILFVGTIEPRKNVAGLLEAYRRIAQDCGHRLVLVGAQGWEREPVTAMIARMGLTERVTWLGYVPDHAELAAFYSAARLFVLPSFYEGFGLPVLEAMTCGCPVVTSPVSSLPEVGGAAASYADPDDPDALAAAITTALADGPDRDAMIRLGLEHASTFSWAESARRTLARYRSLL